MMKSRTRHCSSAVFSLFLICQPTTTSQQFGFSLPTQNDLLTDMTMLGRKGEGFEATAPELPTPALFNPLSEALSRSHSIDQSA